MQQRLPTLVLIGNYLLNNTTEGLLTQLALTYRWGISQSF